MSLEFVTPIFVIAIARSMYRTDPTRAIVITAQTSSSTDPTMIRF